MKLLQPYEADYIWKRLHGITDRTFGDYCIDQNGHVYYNHLTGDRSDADFLVHPDRVDTLSSWTVR